MASLLLKKIGVKPARESNVISISYKASDPGFAAAVANADSSVSNTGAWPTIYRKLPTQRLVVL